MENFIAYLLESSIILGLLTVFYKLVLHNETLFKFNRLYLLTSVLLATVVPFVSFSFNAASSGDDINNFSNVLEAVNVYSHSVRELIVPVIAKNMVFTYLYIAGTMALLLRLLLGFIRLGGLSKKASWSIINGVRVANLPGRFNPFSFFRIIFVNQSLYSLPDLEKILIHEKAHVQLKHSVDVILFELLLILQWFNPFVWFTKFLLKELHEFQADSSVIKNGTHIGEYKMLLLNQATGARLLPVNNLNQSITKKRFKMMTNKTLKNIVMIKSIMAVAVLVSIATFFACTNTDTKPDEIEVEVNSYMDVDIQEEVYYMVDVMPQFPGGDLGLRQFIASNVKYPKEAVEQGKAGRVYIQFIVDEDGKVIGSKVARSAEFDALDEEALRVVNSMPDWKAGLNNGKAVKVSYVVPINFQL